MDNTQGLLDKLNEYKEWVEKAKTANTVAEVDKAKVEGIKALKRILFLLKDASKDIYVASQTRRAEVLAEGRRNAYNLVHGEPTPAVTPEIEASNDAPVEKPKATKKATKKAKK